MICNTEGQRTIFKDNEFHFWILDVHLAQAAVRE
jgi:hypothetical protein